MGEQRIDTRLSNPAEIFCLFARILKLFANPERPELSRLVHNFSLR